jgi:hypothetical protein
VLPGEGRFAGTGNADQHDKREFRDREVHR